MKRGNATGSDNTKQCNESRLWKNLTFQRYKKKNILNGVHDIGHIPEILFKSVFIALPKKQENLHVNSTAQLVLSIT